MTRQFGPARLAALPRPVFLVLMPVSGALAALGMAPIHYAIATIIGLGVLFAAFPAAQTARQGALWAWLFASGYFAVALRWIVEPFQVEADLFGWMAPIALALLSSGLALFWGLSGWFATRMFSGPLWRIAGLVVFIASAEVARAFVLTGFPWAGLAQVWMGGQFAQSLAIVGPHGLALMTLILAGALGAFVHDPRRAGVTGIIALSVLFGLPFANTQKPIEQNDPRPVVRIVQPNAPQHEKWDPEKWQVFFWRQVEATRATPDGAKPDLIVWPETAIPQLMNHADETLAIVADAAQGVPVALGIQRADARGYYNSMIVLDETGQVGPIYDKHHLVPFGEYLPFPAFWRSLGIRALAERADGGYAAGAGPAVLELGKIGKALIQICYETIFPQYARMPESRPDVLLQITNDAWFGVYAGPQQHLAQARMRAIEQGIPVIRSANTGISALIDGNGVVLDQIPLGVDGYIDARVPSAHQITVYGLYGDWPIFAILLSAAVMLLFGTARAKPIDEPNVDP